MFIVLFTSTALFHCLARIALSKAFTVFPLSTKPLSSSICRFSTEIVADGGVKAVHGSEIIAPLLFQYHNLSRERVSRQLDGLRERIALTVALEGSIKVFGGLEQISRLNQESSG
jgi:hypothetical protein